MASEKQTILDLAARTQLLGVGNNEQERRANAARFTAIAAWELREFGWGRISHEGDSAVDGKSADKLLNKHSGEVADIVNSSENTNARAQWIIEPNRLPIDRWIAPVPPAGDEPRDEPQDQPRDERDEFDGEAFAIAATSEAVEALQAIAINLDRIADVLEKNATLAPAPNAPPREDVIGGAAEILGRILSARRPR